MIHIGWPQAIVLGLFCVRVLISAAMNGQPIEGVYHFERAIISTAMWLGILYWGGFFS